VLIPPSPRQPCNASLVRKPLASRPLPTRPVASPEAIKARIRLFCQILPDFTGPGRGRDSACPSLALVHPTGQKSKKCPQVGAVPIVLSRRHGKIQRAGYGANLSPESGSGASRPVTLTAGDEGTDIRGEGRAVSKAQGIQRLFP